MRRHPLPDVDFPNEWEDDIAAPIFPGGRIENINAADAYTIFTFASSILRASTPIKNRKRQVASGSLGRNLHASMRDDTPCFSRISGRRRLTQNPPIAIGILKHRVSAPTVVQCWNAAIRASSTTDDRHRCCCCSASHPAIRLASWCQTKSLCGWKA